MSSLLSLDRDLDNNDRGDNDELWAASASMPTPALPSLNLIVDLPVTVHVRKLYINMSNTS